MYDFDSPQHASGYLSGSVVRYQGQPTNIVDVVEGDEGQYTTHHRLLVNQGRGRNNINDLMDGKFNLHPVPLGMMNIRGDNKQIAEAVYMTRVPERRWKVGLTQNGTRIIPVRYEEDNMFWRMDRQWFLSMDMHDCIVGEYPSFDNAIRMLKRSRRRSVAFSRNFALVAEGKKLMYRANHEPVGDVQADHPSLFPKYEWLYELIMEDYNA